MAERHGADGDDAVRYSVPRSDHHDPYAGHGAYDSYDGIRYDDTRYHDTRYDNAVYDERDPYRDPDPYHGDGYHDPEPPSGALVAQHRAVPHSELRADFGAHLETHYPRLVAQLYAITLHPGDAHGAVQDAYSRAWRRWAELSAEEDVLGWVRRVAVRTSMRGWRPGLTRAGLRRSRLPAADTLDPDTASLLHALSGLPIAVRRAVVLRHMAGLSIAEIAELERVHERVLRERLRRGRDAVRAGMDEMLGSAVGAADADESHGRRHGRGERA